MRIVAILSMTPTRRRRSMHICPVTAAADWTISTPLWSSIIRGAGETRLLTSCWIRQTNGVLVGLATITKCSTKTSSHTLPRTPLATRLMTPPRRRAQHRVPLRTRRRKEAQESTPPHRIAGRQWRAAARPRRGRDDHSRSLDRCDAASVGKTQRARPQLEPCAPSARGETLDSEHQPPRLRLGCPLD